MLCARCGAANAETAPLCGNCGASLKKQPGPPTAINTPGQPFAANAGEMPVRSIDELPTAHLPSVAGPSSSVPAPQSKGFPPEAGQAFATLAQPGASVDPQPASDPQLSASDIADYPTKTSVPVVPKSTPPATYPAGMVLHEQGASSPSPAPTDGAPPAQFARPGMFSLPSRSKKSSPSSQPGLNTPPGVATPPVQPVLNTPPSQPNMNAQLAQANMGMPPVQPVLNTPPAQPNMSAPPAQPNMSPPGAMRPPAQYTMNNMRPGSSMPPSQPNMNMPPSQAGMGRPPSQPGMNGVPMQAGMGRPPSQPGMGAQPPQAGGPWQGGRGDGNHQMPPAPERLGNVSPGPLERAVANGPTSQGGAMASPGQLAVEEINKFVRPLPRWAAFGGPVVGALLLIGLIFVNPDWATGATIAGMVAIILAILLGIATGVRVALGMLKETNPRRRSQMISTVLLVLLLLLFSGGGISQQSSLHMIQGRYLESQQNWSAAIAEYQAAGEKSTAAVDVARAYDEWGEAQDKQQQYGGAVTSFSMVIQNYQQATNEFNRAKTDIVAAYLGWADQASQQQNYTGATAHYDALLALVFCDANSCMQLAQPKDATAYYHLAEQQLAEHQYTQAVNAYQALTLRFPKAPEVSQIHAHYAQALWGKGQQQVNTSCSAALTTYRLLAKLFADTPEGKQAATALTKPVQVKGHFTQSVPGAPYHPTAFLVQGLTVGIQQYQFPPLLAHAPTATIHSDGSFTFSSVPQGTYELVWSSDNTLHFYYAFSGKHVLYVAHLGQLCAFDYGVVNQAIPTK